MVHNQVFQDREFPIDCHDKRLQIPNREDKADVADAMTLLESKQYPPFIVCGDTITTDVVNGERKGRRMCEHVFNGRAICTDEGKTQVGCRTKSEVSPSLANMCESIPPWFLDPPPKETVDILLVFA
jgi:hypothetical protein